MKIYTNLSHCCFFKMSYFEQLTYIWHYSYNTLCEQKWLESFSWNIMVQVGLHPSMHKRLIHLLMKAFQNNTPWWRRSRQCFICGLNLKAPFFLAHTRYGSVHSLNTHSPWIIMQLSPSSAFYCCVSPTEEADTHMPLLFSMCECNNIWWTRPGRHSRKKNKATHWSL